MEHQTEITAIAKPARRPFQFRLRTLMIIVTLSAVACAYGTHWYRARQRADAAFAERDKPRYIFVDDFTMVLWEPTVQAGRNWCLAKCAVPFSNRADACRWYLDRLEKSRSTIQHENASAEYLKADFAKLAGYKQEAEQWLADGTASGEPTELTYPKSE